VAYTATGASDKIEAPIGRKVECVGAYFLSFQTILSFLSNDTSFFLSFFLTMSAKGTVLSSKVETTVGVSAFMAALIYYNRHRYHSNSAPTMGFSVVVETGEVLYTGTGGRVHSATVSANQNEMVMMAKRESALSKARMTLAKRRLAKGCGSSGSDQ